MRKFYLYLSTKYEPACEILRDMLIERENEVKNLKHNHQEFFKQWMNQSVENHQLKNDIKAYRELFSKNLIKEYTA